MPANPPAARDIFIAAAELTADQRPAYLDRVCGDDAELRRRVEALLRAHDSQPTGDYTPPSQTPTELGCVVGERIGPYKLIQELGEGGMGTVWLAGQSEPVRRQVALKVIKAGMDTAMVIARFEAERQALALMDHPNIAKILDAGATAAGRPYFVMELVKGIPITKFADQERLTPTERLELFIPVCQAVQHAHQKGIIHRDLKPSNVIIGLYDGRPIPKIIDFGVAKATQQQLTDCSFFTGIGNIVGTLEYMAPEQAELNNLDIDTRADIYSLGVILYELLAGSPPFSSKQLRSAAFTEMLRVIREVEPPKPSTKLSSSDELPNIAANRKLEPARLTKIVHGDLDWIAMKCLEKERGRRYDTANELALELQRFLANQPVLAGPPSARYRLRKFVSRNRAAVVAAGILLGSLVVGIAGIAWQAHLTELARQDAVAQSKIADGARIEAEAKRVAAEVATKRAEANFRLAFSAFDDMVHGIQNKLANRPDTQDVRKELLENAQKGLQVLLKNESRGDRGDSALNWAHFRNGDIFRTLGNSALALQQYRMGYDRAKAQCEVNPNLVTAQHDLCVALQRLGEITQQMGNPSAALEYYQQSHAIRERLAKSEPENLLNQRNLLISFNSLGMLSRQLGQVTNAREYHRQNLEISERLANADPMNVEAQLDLIRALENLGDLSLQLSNVSDALNYYRRDLEVIQRLVTAIPHDSQAKRSMGTSLLRLGDVTRQMGNTTAATDYYRQCLIVRERLVKDDPKNVEVLRDLSVSLNRLGDMKRQQGNSKDALEYYRRSLEIRERLARTDTKNLEAQRDLSVSLSKLGDMSMQLGNVPVALEYYQHSLDVRERLAKSDPRNTEAQRDLSIIANKLGDLALKTGDAPGALKYFRASHDIRERLAKADTKDVRAQRDLSISFDSLGTIAQHIGDVSEALNYYRQSFEIRQQLARDNPKDTQAHLDVFISEYNIGFGYQAALQFAESAQWLEKANASLVRFQTNGWITKPEQMIGTWSLRQWVDAVQARLVISAKAEQAIADLTFALQQPANQISRLLEVRVQALAMRRDLFNCVATTEAMEKYAKNDAKLSFLTARMWSQCSGLATTQKTDNTSLASEYGDKAMEWLHKAVAAGFTDVADLNLHRDFAAIRDRDDFKSQVKKLESRVVSKKLAEK